MNDAKARAYAWAAYALTYAPISQKPEDEEFRAEAASIIESLTRAAARRAAAPEVPPVDLEMVAPGMERPTGLAAWLIKNPPRPENLFNFADDIRPPEPKVFDKVRGARYTVVLTLGVWRYENHQELQVL